VKRYWRKCDEHHTSSSTRVAVRISRAHIVLAIEVTEGSAKIRSAGPSDVEEDYALPIRAGVIPIQTQVGPLIPDWRNLDGFEIPEHIANFQQNRGTG
jgi:hypothetical protein